MAPPSVVSVTTCSEWATQNEIVEQVMPINPVPWVIDPASELASTDQDVPPLLVSMTSVVVAVNAVAKQTSVVGHVITPALVTPAGKVCGVQLTPAFVVPIVKAPVTMHVVAL